MLERQSQHCGTSCDKEGRHKSQLVCAGEERSQQASTKSSPAKMGDSIKCGNKYQSGRGKGAHNKK